MVRAQAVLRAVVYHSLCSGAAAVRDSGVSGGGGGSACSLLSLHLSPPPNGGGDARAAEPFVRRHPHFANQLTPADILASPSPPALTEEGSGEQHPMSDRNGRRTTSGSPASMGDLESPPSVCSSAEGEKKASTPAPSANHAHLTNLCLDTGIGGGLLDRGMESGASSPLLQTEAMPEEDLSCCPYCKRDFRKPRVLDCLHSMCEDCIIAQLDGRRDAAKGGMVRDVEARIATDCVLEERVRTERPTPPGVIRCPVCLQESHVGNDIRFVHAMLIDFVRVNEAEEAKGDGRPCRSCKSEQQAMALCKHCGHDLCGNCLKAHREMRMFEGHETVSYAELAAAGREGDVRRVLCPIHGAPYYLLCATCEALICRSCLDMEIHNSHKVIDVNEVVVEAIAKELMQHMTGVQEKWQSSLDVWKSAPDRHASLHSQYEDAKVRVEAAYEEALKVLEETKVRKLAELEEARDTQETKIDELYKKIDATQQKVDDSVRFSSRLLSSANGVELLASRKKVIHQLRSLEHTMPTLSTECELHFSPSDRKKMESQMSSAVGLVFCRTVPMGGAIVVAPEPGGTVRIGADNSVTTSASSEWGEDLNRGVPRVDAREVMQRAAPGGGIGVIGGGAPGMPTSASSGALNGGSSAISQATITPIGGERAAKKAQSVVPVNATASFNGGWPPSSNPPELPSPSPPKGDGMGAVGQGAPVATSSSHSIAPPTSLPSAVSSSGAVPGLPSPLAPGVYPPWGAIGAPPPPGDPRAALLQAFGFPQAPGTPPPNPALMAAQMQVAKNILIQSGNVQALQQFQRHLAAAALGHSAAGGPTPELVLRQMVQAAASVANADPSAHLAERREAVAPGLGAPALAKGVSEIKLAFAHGTGHAGNNIRELNSPGGFAVNENDELLVADTGNHRIVVITTTIGPWMFGRTGQDDGQLCFPRRVVAMRGGEPGKQLYVVIDKATDNKSRAQLFNNKGDFVRRINLTAVVPKGGIEVWAATSTPTGHLVMVDQSSVIYILDIKEAQPRVVNWFDASGHLLEASDVAVHEKSIFVTDFKGHCVHVFSHEGTYLRKIGEPSHTPFPIGVDITRTGELFVGHTHGNKLTIVVYSADGSALLQQLVNVDFRMSRCASLRLTGGGHIITLSKHAHTLYGFKRVGSR